MSGEVFIAFYVGVCLGYAFSALLVIGKLRDDE